MAGTGAMPKRNSGIIERVPAPTATVVPVRLMLDVIFKAVNTPSGREYVFHRAGSIVNVDIQDVDWFLNKRQNKGCCGGGGGQGVFELAGDI